MRDSAHRPLSGGTDRTGWRRARAAGVVTVLLAGLAVPLGSLVAPTALADPPEAPAAGAFDPTFSGDGTAYLPDPRPKNGSDPVGAPVLDTEGAAVLVTRPRPGPYAPGEPDHVLHRYRTDGTVDPTYRDSSGAERSPVRAGRKGVVGDGSGGTYVAGCACLGEAGCYVTLEHYTRTGQRDTGFGHDGTARTDAVGELAALTYDPAAKRLIVLTHGSSGGSAITLTAVAGAGRTDVSPGAADTAWGSQADTGGPSRTGRAQVTLADGHRGTGTDLEVDGSGRLYVVGSVRVPEEGGEAGVDEVLVARLTAQGELDRGDRATPHSGYGQGTPRSGVRYLDAAGTSGRSDEETARALTVQPDGTVTVAGETNPGNDGYDAFAARLSPKGALVTSWGADGGITRLDTYGEDASGSTGQARALDVALDTAGRVLLVGEGRGSSGKAHPGVARLGPDGRVDPLFGQDGARLVTRDGAGATCVGALLHVQAVADDRVLATGTCGKQAVLMRFVADVAAPTSLTLEASAYREPTYPGDQPQGADGLDQLDATPYRIAVSRLDRARLAEAAAQVQSAPVRFSPVRFSPVRFSPVRFSPVRFSPVDEDSPLAGTPAITLAQIPLTPPLDWATVLEGTEFEDLPLQTVLVSEVLAAADAQGGDTYAAIRELVLGSIDLSDTPLGEAGLGAVLLGGTPLLALPPPNGVGSPAERWCAYLASHGTSTSRRCTGDGPGSLADESLLSLEIGGVDLTDYYAEDHSLVGTRLQDSPLAFARIADLALDRIALGDLRLDQLAPSIRDDLCPGCDQTRTLETLDLPRTAAGTPPPASPGKDSVQALLDAGFATDALNGVMSLTALTLGLLAPEDLPLGGVDLDPLLDAYEPEAQTQILFTSALTAPCADVAAGLRMDLRLPAGSLVRGGDVQVLGQDRRDLTVTGPGAPPEATPPPAGSRVVISADGGGLRATHQPQVPPCAGTARVVLRLRVQAPRRVETLPATAVAKAGTGPDLVSSPRSVRITDPHDEAAPPRPGEQAAGQSTLPLAGDQLTLGWLGASGRADLYTLEVADRSTVDLTLSHLPADYDLIVYDGQANTSGGREAGLPNSPARSPVRFSPVRFSPVRFSPVDDSGPDTGQDAAEVPTALPERPQGVPLLDKRIRATSTGRGQDDEAVSLRIRPGEATTLVVAVAPYNGARSSLPYVLSTRVTEGPPLVPCTTRTFATPGPAPAPATAPTVTSTTQSLILTSQDRMDRLYGPDPELRAKVALLALEPTVRGTVLDVTAQNPQSERDEDVRAAYTLLDEQPCSVPRANAVVTAINQYVDEVRQGPNDLRFLTIVGNDDVIPMGRVPDLADVANQDEYAPAARVSLLGSGPGDADNPVSRAFAERFVLSDDPYAALAPSAFLDTQLFVPDLAVGRLVETPGHIKANIDEFRARAGIRNLTGAYTASYDFLLDLGTQLEATKAGIPRTGTTDQPPSNSEVWTREEVSERFKRNGTGFSSVNAHFDNNRALPADQNAADRQDELLSANATPAEDGRPARAADLPPSMITGILATVGCNAGVNISNLLLPSDESRRTDKHVSRANDWAQRISELRGVFVANTGFGYGDTVSMSYSEKLMAGFARNMNGSMTIGQALQFAKQQYLENGTFGVYDHKALTVATYYGLPQWRLRAGDVPARTVLPVEVSGATAPYVTTDRLLQQNPTRVTGSERGDHFRVGSEEPQVTAYRPVQPRTDVVLTPPSPGAVPHGATLESLTTREEGIDPVIAVPIVDESELQPEPPVRDAFFPDALQQLVTRTSPQGTSEHALVLVPGQFRDVPFSTPGRAFPGTQRLVTRTDVKVNWSDSRDFTAPEVLAVDGGVDAARRLMQITVRVAPDEDDTVRVLALYLTDGDRASTDARTWGELELVQGAGGVWSARAVVPAGTTDIDQFYVQAVDQAGNVSVQNDKGRNFRAEAEVLSPQAGDPSPTSPAPSPTLGPAQPVPPLPSTPPSAGTTSPEPGQVAPSASPDPSRSTTAPPPTRPVLQLDARQITAGRPVRVSGRAAPGSEVVVWAYSRPSTTYRAVRRLVAGADGSFQTSLYPGTNTRLYVSAAGRDSDSVVVLVRPLISTRAEGRGRAWTFTGTVRPARPGVLVTLYRRTTVGEVITAQGVTDARGGYRIRRLFVGSGTWTFVVRTESSLVSVAAAGPPRRIRLG